MKTIEIPRDFLESVEKSDLVFSRQINKVFSKYGYDNIGNYYDAEDILSRCKSIDLSNDLFEELNLSSDENVLIWLDLVCDSMYPKLQIAKWLIERIERINASMEFTAEVEHLTWFLCEKLRQLKQLKYFDEYVKILSMKKLSTSRIPIVDLVSYSRRKEVNDILLQYIDDYDINGHVLYSLNRRHYEGIYLLADKFADDEREFVKKLVKRLKKQNK